MNPLDFVSSSFILSKKMTKLKLELTQKFFKQFEQKCIHISVLQSRKLRLRESTRLKLSSVLMFGVCQFECPPLTALKNILITHDISK